MAAKVIVGIPPSISNLLPSSQETAATQRFEHNGIEFLIFIQKTAKGTFKAQLLRDDEKDAIVWESSEKKNGKELDDWWTLMLLNFKSSLQ